MPLRKSFAQKPLARFVLVTCGCGEHLISVEDMCSTPSKSGFVTEYCLTCKRPLVVLGADGHLYVVGEKLL